MDPLSAISLAGCVLQFVETGFKIVSFGKEIYQSSKGSRRESVELESITESLSQAHQALRYSFPEDPRQRSKQESRLLELIEQCDPIYKELQSIIAKVRVQGDHRKWKSFCAAVKLVWKEDQISDLEKRLSKIQRQIDSEMIGGIRSQQQLSVKLLQELAENSRRLEINRLQDIRQLNTEVERYFRILDSIQNEAGSGGPVASFMRWVGVLSAEKISERPADALLINLSEQARRAKIYTTERQIINLLTFKEMGNRHLDIKQAHTATFEWIFSSSTGRPSPSCFREWLIGGKGIFWISGKPGSGKSTLMKFVFGDPRTHALLAQWAGKSKLISASFYFWNAGTPMQKSIKGLLMSLVCQVLRQCPSLIPTALPKEWLAHVEFNNCGGPPPITQIDNEVLSKAIESFKEAKNLDTKFCFFVDGLDEYDGFDREIAHLMVTLASSSAIKLCVASRPHNAFLNTFGKNPKQMFYVHEFTDHDMRKYIKDTLEGNPEFVSRKDQDPNGYRQLAEYIRAEANGVFLWVFLVVVSVLEGIDNSDRMSDLQRKLKKVPTDLKLLFKHILNSVEEDYHEQQAQMLHVACQAHEPLNLICFSFLDEEDSNFALKSAMEPMEAVEVTRRCEEMARRVVARCKLLVEVVERPGEDPYFGLYVAFLHRTVRDYLREEEAQQVLKSRLKAPFDPKLEICNALLAQAKSARAPSEDYLAADGPIHMLVHHFLRQAHEIEGSGAIPLDIHISQLQEAVHKLNKGPFTWWSQEPSKRKGGSTVAFLELIIRHKLPHYLQWRFEDSSLDNSLTSTQLATLLDCALRPTAHRAFDNKNYGDEDLLCVGCVKVLLAHNADPNQWGFRNSTPWRLFLESLSPPSDEIPPAHRDVDVDRARLEVLEQLVKNGADLNYVHYGDVGRQYGRSAAAVNRSAEANSTTIESFVRRVLPRDDAQYIVNLIEDQRKQKPWYRRLGW